MAPVELDAGTVRDRLASAEAIAKELSKEERALQEELERWHQVSIAARDSRLVQVMEEQAKVARAAAAGGGHRSNSAVRRRRRTGNEGAFSILYLEGNGGDESAAKAEAAGKNASSRRSHIWHMPDHAFLVLEIVAVALSVLLAVGFVQQVKSQGTFAGTLFRRWSGHSDRLEVEIAELRVGDLGERLVNGDLHIVVQPSGKGDPMRTRAGIPNFMEGEQSFVTFTEVLAISVSMDDEPCKFSVFDCRGLMETRIAEVSVPATEILDMAKQRRQYFTLDATGPGMPYIAMRVRELAPPSKRSRARRPTLQERLSGPPF